MAVRRAPYAGPREHSRKCRKITRYALLETVSCCEVAGSIPTRELWLQYGLNGRFVGMRIDFVTKSYAS
jgi:hypothetical protein